VRQFIFRCPQSGLNVQGYHAGAEAGEGFYVGQKCLACGGVHLVNPVTGKLLSEERPLPEQRE
jgi:hypothetical protein